MAARPLEWSKLLLILVVATTPMSALPSTAGGTSTPFFHPYDSGIVYLLPSGDSTPYWQNVYGYREAFWVYSNITEHKSGILNDLDMISRSYRFVILILPLDDTPLYYYNLKQLDSWAAEKNLKVVYAFFPKSKFGAEWNYLNPETTANAKMIYNMRFLFNLTSTSSIAIWYGWTRVEVNAHSIEHFYDSLPKDLRASYYVWLDGQFVGEAIKHGLPQLADKLNITVVTELYEEGPLARYGFAFKRQVIVTGAWGAASAGEWRAEMVRKLSFVQPASSLHGFEPRKLAVWTFWDRSDGSREEYTAYIDGSLSNPLLTTPPAQVIVDSAGPIDIRVDVGSTQKVWYHLSWSDGFTASDIVLIVNDTSRATNTDGYTAFPVNSDKTTKLTWVPTGAEWGPYQLGVVMRSGFPSVIFDKVIVQLQPISQNVELGTNATVSVTGFYEYDRTPFEGPVFLNDTTLNKTAGTYYYSVKGIDDRLHGLTVFESNMVKLTLYEKSSNQAYPATFSELLLMPLIGTLFFLLGSRVVKRIRKKGSPLRRR